MNSPYRDEPIRVAVRVASLHSVPYNRPMRNRTGHLVVAIDGPVASGKSSVGERVAQALGCPLVDTGLMYRAVT